MSRPARRTKPSHKLKPGKILWVECGLYKYPKARVRVKRWTDTTCKKCLARRHRKGARP
jgi:hypothetical protein